MPKIAIVQRPPVLLDRRATLQRALDSAAEAAEAGASLVVFPESYIPGYPSWIWRTAAGRDGALMGELHAKLLDNAVDLDAGDLSPLLEAARRHAITIVCGLDENVRAQGGGTLYNTVVTIGPQGTVLNRHRKLMPTNPERMVHGCGDGAGLQVVETPAGRIGTLICWENYMPLARYALYAQGIQVYIAPTYDCGDSWIATLGHIAREGRCWVVGSGTVLRAQDLPDNLPGRRTLFADPQEWINPGDSVVVDPQGKVVAGPMRREIGVLYADIDLSAVAAARRTLDVAGHYARPDIFDLTVRRTPAAPVRYVDTMPIPPTD